MRQNRYYSYNHKQLCDGCRQCVRGKKTVIYITGLCPRRCYYCPLSDNKRFKDKSWANERPVTNAKEIIEEALISKSEGAGITGGDPLLVLDRTVGVIKALKRKFGKNFHIHLYTSLNLVNEESLDLLYKAGLNEIRFHPDLDDDKFWPRIAIAAKFRWKKGIEIPAIPGYYGKIMKLVDRSHDLLDFLNLNELEISDTNGNNLGRMGFRCKDNLSYAIKGSDDLALKILKECSKRYPKLPVHYCTSRLKDKVQMANRLKLRAKSIAKELDWVDDEGMIIRGFIEAGRKEMAAVKKEFKIPSKFIEYDPLRKQILIAPWIIKEIYSEIDHKSGIVKEYPSWDRMIVEKEYY